MNYCNRTESVPFTLLLDDDYIVSIPNLIKEVSRWHPSDRLYTGWRFDVTPFRSRIFKHRVSLILLLHIVFFFLSLSLRHKSEF